MSDKASHTPWPWRWDRRAAWRIVAGEDDTVATTGCRTGMPFEANARLIAAAPDMLRELIGILEWARVEKAPLRKQEIDSIARLVAKVTGETSQN